MNIKPKAPSEDKTSTGNSTSINLDKDLTATNNDNSSYYNVVLPKNLEIFSGIVNKAKDISNPAVSDFAQELLLSFRNQIVKVNNSDVFTNNLSKLNLNILQDQSVLIEWNFENFRIGFSIETKLDESSYYIISRNKERGTIMTKASRLVPSEFNIVIQDIIIFVLRNT